MGSVVRSSPPRVRVGVPILPTLTTVRSIRKTQRAGRPVVLEDDDVVAFLRARCRIWSLGLRVEG